MDYDKIEFNDEFEDDNEICDVCGCNAMRRVGYNEKEDLLKFECPECEAVIIEDGMGETTLVKGEMRDWSKYLAENLSLPFDAVALVDSDWKVSLFRRSCPIRSNDIITVVSICFEDKVFGVVASVMKATKNYTFPLMDLEPIDKESPNAKLLGNYGNWSGCR